MVASERVFKVLDNPDLITNQGEYAPQQAAGRVDFEKVWFAYHDEQWVLKNISFNLEPGKTLAIVGHTGSGKTSIISLINRLYHIQKGEIRIDGVKIEDYKLDDLRNNLVNMSQRYKQDIIVVEYSQLKREVHDIVFNLPGGKGKGTAIWEPLNTWEKVFDEKGNSNNLVLEYDEISKKFLTK